MIARFAARILASRRKPRPTAHDRIIARTRELRAEMGLEPDWRLA